MRYIIVFLIGFFVGGLFGGDLGLFLNKSKNLIFEKIHPSPEKDNRVATSPKPAPKPKTVEIAQPVPKPVTQAVTKPEPAPAVKAVTAGREKIYSVQVASFKTRDQASRFVDELIKQELDAYIAPARPSEPVNRYRVCIGESISLDQARALNTKLKPKFKDSFIYQF